MSGMADLRGKTALVTGASSGIGAAIARELARRGADVVLAARREDRLRELAAEIEKLGRRAIAVACDVTKDGDLERAVARARDELGGLDIAVANAGFGVAGPLVDLTVEDYRRQLETNVFGVLRTIYAALPEVRKRRGGIAIVGSVSGHVPTAGTSAYCASKFAVRGLSESIVTELAREGVAVTLVSPGFVESEIRAVDNRGALHQGRKDPVPRWLMLSAESAAREIVGAILARRREVIVTRHGRAAVFLYRHAPWLVRWVMRRVSLDERRIERDDGARK